MGNSIIFIATLLLQVPTLAATYYISPGGSASNLGTYDAPFKKFSDATLILKAGDTLVLKDGTYSLSENGNGSHFIYARCDTGEHKNGNSDFPITVKAENKRQAFLSQNGSGTNILVYKCSHWSFEDLRAQSGDYNNPNGNFFYVYGGDHISFKRNLLSNNNRYRNEALISYDQSNYGLVEENEFYSYHRNCVGLSASSNAKVRRNYANSRNYADLPDGRYSGPTDRGDDFVVLYPSSNSTVENNIAENNGAGFSIEAAGWNDVYAFDNKFLGNISLGNINGFTHSNRVQDSTLGTPTNTLYSNNVAINSSGVGYYIRTSYNTIGNNNTAMGSGIHGFAWDKQVTNGVPGRSFYFDNTLSVNNSYGTYISDQTDWLLAYVNSYNNSSGNFYPSVDSKRTPSSTINPNLGTCKVWIPDSSPMKRAGKNGADIGANVLYRYEDGVLTSKPLWNTTTGKFPCGVVVPGVNDIAGSSCGDVHTRLNVNTNGCLFPAGYGSGIITKPGAPAGLRVI